MVSAEPVTSCRSARPAQSERRARADLVVDCRGHDGLGVDVAVPRLVELIVHLDVRGHGTVGRHGEVEGAIH